MKNFLVPFPLEADAYQLGHFLMIPQGMNDFQCSQGMFRRQFAWGDQFSDSRVVAAGMLAFAALELERFREEPLTMEEIDETEEFLRTFQANPANPGQPLPYPFDRRMFKRIVKEFGGVPPICLMGLREGQAHYVGEPFVQAFTDVPGMGELTGHIESSMLPYYWASAAVATRGRIRKQKMMEEMRKDFPHEEISALIPRVEYGFHDFGRRGAHSAQITGMAHLLNYLGTDTLDAAFAAWKYLNWKRDFGARSIMAAAHRTVTPWERESSSIDNMVKLFGHTIFAFVADSYGYEQGIKKLAQRVPVVRAKGGWIVGRPDSGDVVQTIILGLREFEGVLSQFDGGVTRIPGSNLKLLNGASIIQGDGVSDNKLFTQIYPAVRTAGFSIANVAIGMGEYNHRSVRSDLELAWKICSVGINEAEGAPMQGYRGVMKDSDTDYKRSLPTPVSAHLSPGVYERRFRKITPEQLVRGETGDFAVYFDGRPNGLPVTRQSFSEARERTWQSWNDLLPNRPCDTLDPEIRVMQKEYLKRMEEAA